MADRDVLRIGPVRPWGRGWIAEQPAHMQRASYALAEGDRVWLVDPVDGPGLAQAVAEIGRVAGVIRLLDRHERDCAALAERYGVGLHTNPVNGVAGAPFEPVVLTQRRWWREVALWWPAHRALIVPEALGTSAYFRLPGARVGVHPMLRLTPPHALLRVAPRHLLTGHGGTLEGDGIAGEVRAAVRGARRETPRWLASLPRTLKALRAART